MAKKSISNCTRWMAGILLSMLTGIAMADYLAYAVGPKSRVPLPENIDHVEVK